jgi:DNA polymerase-3 subunit alpha
VPVGEVDIELGDGWPMTPEIKSALKSLPGVAAVEDVV